MKIKLSIALAILVCIALLQSCARESALPVSDEETEKKEQTVLTLTEDRGKDYIDSFVFFGESTTYHMKNRGVLSGGKNTRQVLADKSGTAMLDLNTGNMTVCHPDTGRSVPLAEAIEYLRPQYIILTFGLNGAVQNTDRGIDYFQACYKKLIDKVHAASPETKIIIQSCFPVAKNMDMSNYSVNVEELNRRIRTLNEWALQLAEKEDLRYLNTWEVLTDKDGYLKLEYQSGDGHHLTREAYTVILDYIRTHGYK